mgnify:FL=1
MRAQIVRELGSPDVLSFDELDPLLPGPGQVLIDMHAAGVNFPDTLIIEGK